MKLPSRLKLGRKRERLPRVPTDPAIRAFRLERRKARLRVIPTLFTLGNAACGFAAIVQVAALRMDPVAKGIENPENLAHAAWLILLAMVFDALDGRIARMTETTGDFGGELDSLCDAVSFGVAPGLMVAMVNAKAVTTSPMLWKAAWLFGLAYACGAILRLARFNVENTHDEEAHLSFKGLPSPAAAGTVISSVLFMGFLQRSGWHDAARWMATALPVIALGAGYLMVSTLRYVHVPNRYLRGRKSVRRIAQIFFLGVLVFALFPEVAIFLAFAGFALSGPIGRLLEITGLRGDADPATVTADGVSPSGDSREEVVAAAAPAPGATAPAPALPSAAGSGAGGNGTGAAPSSHGAGPSVTALASVPPGAGGST